MAKPWQKLKRFIVDTHCHVGNYPEPQAIIDSLEREQMHALMMTINPPEFIEFQALHQSPNITACLGLFPLEFSRDDYQELEEQFFQLLEANKNIGEVGLDFTVDQKYQERQSKFLTRLVSIADQQAINFLSLHSRRASTETIQLLSDQKIKTPAILHWFSGSIDDVKRASTIENIYFSINPAMIKSRSSRQWLALIPKERILLETDGPYIKMGSRGIIPKDLTTVVEHFSKLWDLELPEAMQIIHDNWLRIKA